MSKKKGAAVMAAPRKGDLSGLNLIDHLGIGVQVAYRKVGIGLSVFIPSLHRATPDEERFGVFLNNLSGFGPAFIGVKRGVLCCGIARQQGIIDGFKFTSGDFRS